LFRFFKLKYIVVICLNLDQQLPLHLLVVNWMPVENLQCMFYIYAYACLLINIVDSYLLPASALPLLAKGELTCDEGGVKCGEAGLGKESDT
jgi:hypothetical protein